MVLDLATRLRELDLGLNEISDAHGEDLLLVVSHGFPYAIVVQAPPLPRDPLKDDPPREHPVAWRFRWDCTGYNPSLLSSTGGADM